MAYRVADEALPFTDADLEKIRKKIGDNMNSACTGCGYCDNCPQSIRYLRKTRKNKALE